MANHVFLPDCVAILLLQLTTSVTRLEGSFLLRKRPESCSESITVVRQADIVRSLFANLFKHDTLIAASEYCLK